MIYIFMYEIYEVYEMYYKLIYSGGESWGRSAFTTTLSSFPSILSNIIIINPKKNFI